jgi:hypothetical protein
MKNKIVLYTIITNNYDELKELPDKFIRKDIDYLCLTDDNSIISETYQIIKIDTIKNNPKLTQRYYKIVINNYIKDYDISIYIDGKISIRNQELTQPQVSLYNFLFKLQEYDLVTFKHYKRDCIYKEGAVLLHPYKQIEVKENVIPLIQKLKSENFPKKYSLNDTCILIRKHSDNIVKTMELWFSLVEKYSLRDQLSFMYCIWKNNTKIKLLESELQNIYFKTNPHLKIEKPHKYWKKKKINWLECYDPYENCPYYFNYKNRLCKWDLNDACSEEHYKFLEIGKK